MAPLSRYREIIQNTLLDYASIPYAYGDIQTEAIFDQERDHYALVNVGWDQNQRVHGSLIHIDLIKDKIWIQCDNTEHGVAADLVRAGIPREHIVLGFRPARIRRHTVYAIS